MKVKEESLKAGLNFNIQKNKIIVSGPIPSWQIDGATVETASDFFIVHLSHSSMTTGKTIAFLYGPLLAKLYLCSFIHCLGLS